ncbi:MAG: aspartyl/glutamyl-tRNA amidotransferase subunit C [Oscillospiraceae bacterium]|nr:aspartyl/glutamyl-tRNA amidotransferase subunit C [Oscillospiraceae bacterium]
MITKEEILDIATLSKLYVPAEKLEGLTADMADILAFADTINATGVQAEEYEGLDGLLNVFREDVLQPSYPPEEILQNAGGGENGYFPVKKRK